MTSDLIAVPPPTLPGPIASSFDVAMARLPTLWARLMIGLADRDTLRSAVREAEALDKRLVAEVRQVGRQADRGELATFLRMLVAAWPNASQNDLAGYSIQLSQDVERQRPSRYALAVAGQQLRRTMRFLPSISEVLDEIATADKRMADVLKTLDRVPMALDAARAELARL